MRGDGTVRVGDVANGQGLRTLKRHTASVRSVAFSPDGERLASAASDRTVKLWRFACGQDALSFQPIKPRWVAEVARVYPEELPNLPPGSQQIVLGRYLPEGRDQEGEVIVSGVLNGKPFSNATRVSLKDAEPGNSFIPRLWDRRLPTFWLRVKHVFWRTPSTATGCRRSGCRTRRASCARSRAAPCTPRRGAATRAARRGCGSR